MGARACRGVCMGGRRVRTNTAWWASGTACRRRPVDSSAKDAKLSPTGGDFPYVSTEGYNIVDVRFCTPPVPSRPPLSSRCLSRHKLAQI